MAIQSTGEISLTDLATEFEDTAPHGMSEFYREGGLVPGNNTNVPASGAIRMQNFYNSVNELLQAVTANASSVNGSTLFGSDWGSAVPKRIQINSGVTVGKLTIPTGMGGTLEVDVYGEIQGTGGSANGGSGGNAIDSNHSFTLNVFSGGAVRGGGGGGGQGGTGGGGQYTSSNNAYRNMSDPYNGFLLNFNSQSHSVSWARPNFYSYPYYVGGTGVSNNINSHYGNDGAYYNKGAVQQQNNDNGQRYSAINRTENVTTNTNGGAGGNGGVGAGYGQSSSGGSAGSAGGTNAGTGGTGGSGGGFGSAGSTGATGANGNRTNGSAGSGGGAAGKAVNMISGTLTLNNSGTVNGAT